MKPVYLLSLLLVALSPLWGCTEDTFAPGQNLTPEQATPSDLRYATVMGAREYSLIKSGLPTVETGGLIPAFEITGGSDGQGQQLSEQYMSFVSIATPSITNIGNNNDPVEVIEYRNAGVVTIQAGNPFGNGDYYFDIKVTTELKGVQYSTTFERGLHINVGPELPSAIIYIPMAQNLVIGAGTSTTNAYMPSGNPEVTFSLGSDTDKLEIDPATGAISLKAGYAPTEEVTLTPDIIVTSGISGEETLFKGSSDLITIVVSSSPVTLPLQEKYLFTPTFASNNTTSGYRVYIDKIGSMTSESDVWKREGASTSAAVERPDALTGNYSLMNNPSVTPANGNTPHDSWVIMVPQNLSNFSYGFELSATFWIYNQYVAYLSANGLAPCELRIMVSTDYNLQLSSPAEATWTDISDQVTSQVYNGGLGTPFAGIPYPGSNQLVAIDGSTDNDQAKDLKDRNNHSNALWTKCVLDLEQWKDAESFTLAFHHISNFTGTIYFANNLDRMGRFAVSDVYYKAVETDGN